MKKNIKWIITGIFLLVAVALFIWSDRIEPGSIFAGIAGLIAALKSKLFGRISQEEKIAILRNEHNRKRDEWEREKKRYEREFEFLKLKLDSLDNRTEILRQKLDDPSEPVKRSEKEILTWLNNTN